MSSHPASCTRRTLIINCFGSFAASTCVVISLITATATPSAFAAPMSLDEQIRTLIAEKASRTPAQRKLDSQLLLTLRPERFQSLPSLTNRPAVATQAPLPVAIKRAKGASSINIVGHLKTTGASVLDASAADDTIRANVPASQIEELASRSDVRFIGIDLPPEHNVARSNTSEGDKTHQAAIARAMSGRTGAGQKVCVMSDGIDSAAARIATGDLPQSIYVLPGQSGRGDEGTAMLEIVYDLAPGAMLGFATTRGGEAAFARNIRDLANPQIGGCHIIVDDTDYVSESPFQDGVIAEAVNYVAANGVLYFSSAGNSGNLESQQSGTWEGDFNAAHALPFPSAAGYVMHEFSPNVTRNVARTPAQQVFMHWADRAGSASTDYDFYVLDPTGKNVVAFSNNVQDGTQKPFEYTEAAAPYSFPAGTQVVIVKASGEEDRMLHFQWYRGTLTYATSGAARGHSAAAGAISVAATPAAQPLSGSIPMGPFPNAFAPMAKVETFSSDGPRRIFFDVNGNLLAGAAAGNFKSNGGIVRQKPDLTAADGVQTATPGFETFYGTSAAAPHAAAIAALVREANPGMTAAQLRAKLMSSTVAMDNSAQASGAGVLMAHLAVQTTAATGALDVDGNGRYEALADGVLLLRWLFGSSGQALVYGAVGAGAQRTTASDIVAWLDSRRAMFDVDGNARTEALTDGLLVLRYLFGLRGAELVRGAVGNGAARMSAAAIESYIASLMP